MKKLTTEWKYLSRPDQREPAKHWRVWVNCAGRGTGKSFSGLNWIVDSAIERPGDYYVVGKNAKETAEKQFLPLIPMFRARGFSLTEDGATDKRGGILRLPNGSRIYSDASTSVAENVRGYNLSGAWLDEVCVYKNAEEIYKQIQFAVRKGRGQIYISTTPLVTGDANKLLISLIKRRGTHYTRTNAYANLENLNPDTLLNLLEEEGKRRAEEEIWADILGDAGGMFRESFFWDIDGHTFHFHDSPDIEEFEKVVVAYDPAGKVDGVEGSDEHGIIVLGMKKRLHPLSGRLMNYYWVLDDLSDKYSPLQAAKQLSWAFHHYKADCVVAEVNNGWDWISTVIANEDSSVIVKDVIATRGKTIRAEPVVGVYEQRRMHHWWKLGKLENELTSFTPDMRKSPNRADALVWGVTFMEGVKVVQWKPFDASIVGF